MAEFAELLERRRVQLERARRDTLAIFERLRLPDPGMRATVIAGEWAAYHVAELRTRRQRLIEAEADLLSGLDFGTSSPAAAPLQSRSIQAITAELEMAAASIESADLAANASGAGSAELHIVALTAELVTAIRNQLLMLAAPPPRTAMDRLTALVDHLSYMVAKAPPVPAVQWTRVTDAVDLVRTALDESWLRDVGRSDLTTICTVIENLEPAEFDAVIGQLTEDELYRWFHELDGVRGGNFDLREEAELFRLLAERGSPATLFRLANAEARSRFAEIAAAVRTHAKPAIAMEFTEICAAAALDSEEAMVAALAGLADLSERRRRVTIGALHLAGSLDGLSSATEAFLAQHPPGPQDALLIEFFRGLGGAIEATGRAAVDLTVAGLVDRHRFREAWSSMGAVVGLAATDPKAFVGVVIDVETMRHNPARWAGGLALDLATVGLGKLARLGRLGRTMQITAKWVRQIGAKPLLGLGKWSVTPRHIVEAADRLATAGHSLELRAALAELAVVKDLVAELGNLEHDMERLQLEQAIRLLEDLATRVTAAVLSADDLSRMVAAAPSADR